MTGSEGGGHGQLLITSKAGLAEAFDIRDASSCRAFAQALAGYVATLPSSGGAFARPDALESFAPLEIPDRPQLPPPLHHNPWPVLVAGALLAMTLVAWRADLLPTAGRLEAFASDLRDAATRATDRLVGMLHRDAASTPAEETASTRETTDQSEGPAFKPTLASELQPATATATPGEEPAPAAGSGDEQSAAASSEPATPPLQALAASPPASALEPSAGKPATSPLTRSEVIALQAKLQALGFQPGSADGIAGRRTVRAVKAFQRAHGLSATGIINRQILKAILDAPSRQTSYATTATEALAPAEAPEPVPALDPSPADDLLTASERGR